MARDFLRSDAGRRLIMGPFGSGKSVACCIEIFRRSCQQKPSPDNVRRSRWAVIRNTYPDLKNTTVKTWQSWFGPDFGQFINVAPFEHRLRFKLPDDTRVEADVIFLAMDQEQDAKKFLSLEVTGIYFNEVREMKKSLIDAGDGRIGRYPSMKDGGPSWYGLIADTNHPDEDHWIHELDKSKAKGWEFYRQPGGVIKVDGVWRPNPNAENLANLVPDYYERQIDGKSDEWISVYLASEYGKIPVQGSYFFEDIARAEREKRITDVLPDPALQTHTFWDIGVGDDTTIWFGQGSNGQWRWIDYYEMSGKSLAHYAKVLNDKQAERNLVYGSHVWPHDGDARDFSAVKDDMALDQAPTRRQVAEGLGLKNVVVLGRHHKGAQIEAARNLIAKSWFDKTRCADGLKHLRRYKRKYDKVRNVFLDDPEHDEHSHGADGFMTAAMGKDRVATASIAADIAEQLINFKMPGVV